MPTTTATTTASTQATPVLFSHEERTRMRQRVAEQPWAAALLQRLRESARRDPLRPTNPYENRQPYTDAQPMARQTRDLALLHTITGEDDWLEPMIGRFRQEFRLDAMDSPLDAEPPASVSPLNAPHVKNWRPGQWSFFLARGGFLYAYELTRHHPRWQHEGLAERFEQRLCEILAVQKPMLARLNGWGNTNTWYAATGALVGGLLGDEEAIDLAIDGPLGFKASLGLLQDGHFWPETTSYGHQYVKDVLTIIAEVARHARDEDLFAWQTSEGVSLKSMYDGFLAMLFADGKMAAHGDGSGTAPGYLVPEDQRFTTWCKAGHALWNYTGNRNGNTFEIAYHAYRDPRYAWILAQNPDRDTWDHEFWGYAALTHGVTPLGETEPPDASSRVWRAYGGALVRGDESSRYWHSDTPAVYLRDGKLQPHGDSDAGNLLLNAMGRNLYPDLMVKWNYQPRRDPTTGKNANPTPFSKRRFAHNTVSIDCKDAPYGAFGHFGAIWRSGPMTAVTFHENAAWLRRSVGVTDRYVFDWACVGKLFGPEPPVKHMFDYHLHGLGLPELDGVGELAAYTALGEEYGFGPIDTRSEAPDNQWVRPGHAGHTDQAWQAIMREEHPEDPDEPRGVCIRVLGEPGTQVITGHTPYYVSMEGWDASQPEQGPPARLGLLVIRRKAVATEFLVIHQPFRGPRPESLRVHRTGHDITIQGPDFRDTITLPALSCVRAHR